MAESKLPNLILRYEGELDFQTLYPKITSWLRKNNYDVFETMWKDKDATPAGRERLIRLKPEKNVTEYFKYKFDIRWKLMDSHEVSENKIFARFYMTIQPIVIIDWQELGKQRWYEKFYQQFLVKKEIEDVHEAAMAGEAQELLEMIKEELEMVL